MSELALAPAYAPASASNPPLGTLITGVSLVSLFSAYLLYDTYLVRKEAIQTTKNGRAYVARLPDSAQSLTPIRPGGTRLALALAQAKEEATSLKAAMVERTAQEQNSRAEFQDVAQQLAQIENIVGELKRDLDGLR
ncbi:MAG: hypothetical protein WBP72_18915 [Rhodocyclaceae bacterium]